MQRSNDGAPGEIARGRTAARPSRVALGTTYARYASCGVRPVLVTSGNASIAQAGAGFGPGVFLLTLNDYNPAQVTVMFGAGGGSGASDGLPRLERYLAKGPAG